MHPEHRWMTRYLIATTVLAFLGAATVVSDARLDGGAGALLRTASAGWTTLSALASLPTSTIAASCDDAMAAVPAVLPLASPADELHRPLRLSRAEFPGGPGAAWIPAPTPCESNVRVTVYDGVPCRAECRVLVISTTGFKL